MSGPVFPISATVRALERLVLRGGRWKTINIPIRYGFWQHPGLGPVLIDTGYTPRATKGSARSIALKFYSALLRPRLVAQNLPQAWLRAREIDPMDIEHHRHAFPCRPCRGIA